MKKLLFIAVIVILVIGGFSWWFWSLGTLPPVPPRQITLRVGSPGVTVREPGGSVWTSATDGMVIGEGWSVKTDGAGRATIVVADEAESRLDSNSDVTLTRAMLDIQSGVDVQLSLAMGRVWTRVLRFFDLGSSYAVKTSAVVATVRGTAFDVQTSATGTTVAVSDSAVDIVPVAMAATTTDVVAAGSAATYSPSGRALERRALTAEDRNAEWYSTNVAADAAFDARVVSSRTAELKALDGVAPGSALASIASLSQRVHLAVAPSASRGQLADRYVERRLGQIMALVNEGKSGQAAQEFARLENEMKSQSTSADDRLRMQRALAAIAPIVELADVNSPVFPFRQRVESLTDAVTDPKASSGIFARLLAVEDRLDEAERYIAANSLEEAGIALDGATSGIANVVRESAPLMTGFTAEDRRAIEGKIAALQARAAAARTALNAAAAAGFATSTEVIPPGSATSTTSGVASSTASGSDVLSIFLTMTPMTVDVGKMAQFHVRAVLRNGSSSDVSANTTITADDDGIAHVNGLEVTGAKAGFDHAPGDVRDTGPTDAHVVPDDHGEQRRGSHVNLHDELERIIARPRASHAFRRDGPLQRQPREDRDAERDVYAHPGLAGVVHRRILHGDGSRNGDRDGVLHGERQNGHGVVRHYGHGTLFEFGIVGSRRVSVGRLGGYGNRNAVERRRGRVGRRFGNVNTMKCHEVMKFQIPNPKSQKKFFGIWNLEFGIF